MVRWIAIPKEPGQYRQGAEYGDSIMKCHGLQNRWMGVQTSLAMNRAEISASAKGKSSGIRGVQAELRVLSIGAELEASGTGNI